ncbi:MAG TPA: hypothetical protein VHE14_03415 [Solirubrobacteraceae bacterium]|nr:hypothetical protein [Solirubrobacteraceae bacterium]
MSSVPEPELSADADAREGEQHAAELAPVRVLAPQPSGGAELVIARPAVQAAVVVAGGFVAGAATAAVVRRARTRRAVKRRRRTLPDVVSSRSFLVDVHLLGR